MNKERSFAAETRKNYFSDFFVLTVYPCSPFVPYFANSKCDARRQASQKFQFNASQFYAKTKSHFFVEILVLPLYTFKERSVAFFLAAPTREMLCFYAGCFD